jgi:7,8-dihydropterin-6-yl-methyl-4-(beta-D-ribofuranosyl)aminobenzene 5'-phosphate synthase
MTVVRVPGTALLTISLALGAAAAFPAQEAPGSPLRNVKVLVLSTMLADRGIGEWGFAALVEADGKRILFDTGARPDTVLENARELGVDLAGVQDVILTHNHGDHTGGLLALRNEFRRRDPVSLSRAHVGKGIFWSRPGSSEDVEENGMLEIKGAYEKTGGTWVEYDKPFELFPGAWLTGPVPREHPERNWSVTGRVKTDQGLVEDTVPEDQSLVLVTPKGLVLVSGCGHAGIVNTVEYARRIAPGSRLHAAIGGFHLFAASDEALDWTASKLEANGLEQFIGAHCTGIEAVFRIREKLALGRAHAVVGAVGASFELGRGIDPVRLAR